MKISDAALDTAYAWLCHSRAKFPADADIWDLRFHWKKQRAALVEDLDNETYRFSPQRIVTKASGERIHLWSARDALVMKLMAGALPKLISLPTECTHVKGHGGLKATVADVQRHLPFYTFVMRTDVKSYYESIDHQLLLNQLAAELQDRFLYNLLCQYVKRVVECGGLYRDIHRGISRGSALSPLIGAYHLRQLDRHLSQTGLYYVRYMDDILILAPTRWKLRRAVKLLNQELNQLHLEKHPDKTFVGRIEKGFDFLGYRFSRGTLELADITVRKCVLNILRLYEQKQGRPERATLLGAYLTRWFGSVRVCCPTMLGSAAVFNLGLA